MKRGEVWRINLDPTIGAEIKKSRPCVIVNHDAIGILPRLFISAIAVSVADRNSATLNDSLGSTMSIK